MSNFSFLYPAWGEFYTASIKAEALAHPDPRAACFYARWGLEQVVKWLYLYDGSLKRPYDNGLSALIHEPTFRHAVGQAVFTKARIIRDLGNAAVHSHRAVPVADAVAAVRELFHVMFWVVRTYGKGDKPADDLAFNQELLPKEAPAPPQTLAQLQALADDLAAKDAKLAQAQAAKAAVDDEVARLRAELARIKADNQARPDSHDYSEEQTRDYFIDLMLREAGWPLDQVRDREFPVVGMPNPTGKGFVDYVLWGDDGKPLAIVEAKRAKRDPAIGQQQAKLYADCLEQMYGQRPLIFYTNGYEHWLWDDQAYPPRQVQGFLTNDELTLRIQRRNCRLPLSDAPIDDTIAGRYYQGRAIRRIAQAFEGDNDRKALVVMATGAGKTRTVVALCDLLMRCNWIKRVLFLADRKALVTQAANAFKAHLPGSSPVNLLTEKDTEGRVYVSTYPTMMNLIDEREDGRRRFGVGYFDLVIVDEAHRSVYQKYRAIFDYFDALLVGLTATPKDEIDRNTYGLFDLETGVPTDVYGLDEAIGDGYLVPPQAVSVPLKFQREGIRYDDLSDEDKAQWDTLEWSEDGEIPDQVDAAEVNRWLFNIDTVDKVLAHLMTHGQKVAGGDRLGKTIIFAKNHAHAVFIGERFDANYPHLKGAFARVIDFQTAYADSLIGDFSQADKAPHIAISVDMLDTGIDVPEVVNLVFFKVVRSKTKFWQMVGRGTRLRPDLFGPGQDKQFFYIFDYCQNLEYFSQHPDTTDGSVAKSLSHRLFASRLALIAELDQRVAADPQEALVALRRATATRLCEEVAGMSLDNFLVRPQRRWVETFAKPEAWETLKTSDLQDLTAHVAGLPTALVDDDLEAKQFDLLMLRLQVAGLRGEPEQVEWQEKVRLIAAALEDKSSIPVVAAQLPLIQALQTVEYWQDVTAPLLDAARQRLRGLIRLIDKGKRQPVYSDFADELGEAVAVALPGTDPGTDYERFRAKARQFLSRHEDLMAVHKLKWNKPLTDTDLTALEQVLLAEGVGTPADIAKAKEESEGLGLFVRSLVGLAPQAAAEALSAFQAGKALSPNQLEFLQMVRAHLVENGVMDPGRLFASPYTDFHPLGPEGVFGEADAAVLCDVLAEVRRRALAGESEPDLQATAS